MKCNIDFISFTPNRQIYCPFKLNFKIIVSSIAYPKVKIIAFVNIISPMKIFIIITEFSISKVTMLVVEGIV